MRPKSTGRSILALLAGFITVVVLSLGTDEALRVGIVPPLGRLTSNVLFALATAYRIVYNIAGSYLVARLAPNRPMQHALISGLVGLVLSIAGAIATWNEGPGFGPKWYPLALVVTAMPCAWAGAKLFEATAQKAPANVPSER